MDKIYRFIVTRKHDGSHMAMCIDAGCGGLGVGILDAVYDLRFGLSSAWQLCLEDSVQMDSPPESALERVWLAVMSGQSPSAADIETCEIDDPVVSAGSFRMEDIATGRMDVRELELAGVE